jgi:hypothetical protein
MNAFSHDSSIYHCTVRRLTGYDAVALNHTLTLSLRLDFGVFSALVILVRFFLLSLEDEPFSFVAVGFWLPVLLSISRGLVVS